MGHAQKTVNEENYADAAELQRKLELITMHISVRTPHIQPRRIQLLPWVRDRLPPPDARARARRLARRPSSLSIRPTIDIGS
jgi:hypothetical protein